MIEVGLHVHSVRFEALLAVFPVLKGQLAMQDASNPVDML